MVGRRGPKASDKFALGSKLSFPNHEIRMGTPWSILIEPAVVGSAASCSLSSGNFSEVNNMDESAQPHSDDSHVLPSAATPDLSSMKLDFSYGYKFKSDIKKRLASTVHPLGKSNHFILFVSFGRATFKLTEDMVGIALESCIGGNCDDLSVKYLNDRVIRFSVASKAVGFMVTALRSFSCSSFKCFFNLWGNGGPSWPREFSNWKSKCDKE
jgi:hypothetical protein